VAFFRPMKFLSVLKRSACPIHRVYQAQVDIINTVLMLSML
jgi:hypothetical protein